MAKKRMLADVLWEAANRWLSPTGSSGRNDFTCYAVAYASKTWDDVFGPDDWYEVKALPAIEFLRQLGCKPDSLSAFKRASEGEERQGVRYMWLLLAMHVAEDEGIEL
jgi:hypothetical protein